MKRVLFFTHGNPQGYRIQHYFPYLEARGFEVGLITTEAPFSDFLDQLNKADILYIQRVLVNPLKLFRIRRKVRRIVYDFDDAVMYGSKGESATRRRKFKRIIESADAVLCGNRFLAGEAESYKRGNVFYVPTVVDTDAYRVKVHERTTRPLVGWIGSRSTLRYVSDVRNVMELLLKENRMGFKIVADSPPDFTLEGLTFEKWQADREQAALLSFDMGIMPLRDDLWSRGKCGLKLIQYMASGLPSVVHPVGVTREMIEDGVNGFLRSGSDEWKDALETLAGDADLRRNMGLKARETAEIKYALKIWGPRVAEIIDGL